MNKIYLMICLIALIPCALAVNPVLDVSIYNNTISIYGFINYETGYFSGKAPADFLVPVNESLGVSVVCQEVTFQSNVTINPASYCYPVINYFKSLNLEFNQSGQVVVSNTDVQNKYDSCLNEKASLNAGLSGCSKALIEQGEWKQNYTACTTSLQSSQNSLSTTSSEKTQLESKVKENENQKIAYGVGGLILGVIGMLLYTGKWGGPKYKKPEETYNVNQAA